jgi:hypothetical protein
MRQFPVVFAAFLAALSLAAPARAATVGAPAAANSGCSPVIDAVCLPTMGSGWRLTSAPAPGAARAQPTQFATPAALVMLPPSARALLSLSLGRHRWNYAVLWAARSFALWPQPAQTLFAANGTFPGQTGEPALGQAPPGIGAVGGPVGVARQASEEQGGQSFRMLQGAGVGFPEPFFAGPLLPSGSGGTAEPTEDPPEFRPFVITDIGKPAPLITIPGDDGGAPEQPDLPETSDPLMAVPLSPTQIYLVTAFFLLAALPPSLRRILRG